MSGFLFLCLLIKIRNKLKAGCDFEKIAAGDKAAVEIEDHIVAKAGRMFILILFKLLFVCQLIMHHVGDVAFLEHQLGTHHPAVQKQTRCHHVRDVFAFHPDNPSVLTLFFNVYGNRVNHDDLTQGLCFRYRLLNSSRYFSSDLNISGVSSLAIATGKGLVFSPV